MFSLAAYCIDKQFYSSYCDRKPAKEIFGQTQFGPELQSDGSITTQDLEATLGNHMENFDNTVSTIDNHDDFDSTGSRQKPFRPL